MCIAVIGGMDRLEREYINEAEKRGIHLKVCTKPTKDFVSKIAHADGLVIFTKHGVLNNAVQLVYRERRQNLDANEKARKSRGDNTFEYGDEMMTKLTTLAPNYDVVYNKVSHRAKNEAMSVAKAKNIPVMVCHSCGVCTLRNCLNCILEKGDVSQQTPVQ